MKKQPLRMGRLFGVIKPIVDFLNAALRLNPQRVRAVIDRGHGEPM
ncbi:MAG: hypothetical protein IJW40_07585 [Clostridia bacterium]|nr:hypothetical protein [Clostridia bacterium]